MLAQNRRPRQTAAAARAAKRRRLTERLAEYAFILPALLLLSAIILFPMLTAVFLSFHRVDLVPPHLAFMGFKTTFNGLANYIEVIQNPDFQGAFGRTFFFTAFTIIGSLAAGMILALLLDSSIRGRSFWRIVMLTPWVVAPVVAGGTWAWIFETRYGVLNNLIRAINPAAEPVLWLVDPNLAIIAVSLTMVWLRTPFMVIMLLAGLQAVPTEQYEAASVDGASAWGRFRFITIPYLLFVIMVATLLEGIWTFKHFDVIQVMTAGGPGRATEVLSTLVYKTSFEFFRFGPASAMGMLMTVVLMVFAVIYVRLMQRSD